MKKVATFDALGTEERFQLCETCADECMESGAFIGAPDHKLSSYGDGICQSCDDSKEKRAAAREFVNYTKEEVR